MNYSWAIPMVENLNVQKYFFKEIRTLYFFLDKGKANYITENYVLRLPFCIPSLSVWK